MIKLLIEVKESESWGHMQYLKRSRRGRRRRSRREDRGGVADKTKTGAAEKTEETPSDGEDDREATRVDLYTVVSLL